MAFEQVHRGGVTLAFASRGLGEPIVFIHGAFIADSFQPLVEEPSLDGYQLITYHRRGYTGSSRGAGPLAADEQAADCRELLRHVGVESAHVVGHSFGGAIALELARRTPEVVRSLCLLEPALMVGPSAHAYRESLLAGRNRYRAEGASAVMDDFLRARWPDYSRDALEQAIPGAHRQALDDAHAAFEFDIGLTDWTFSEDDARRIACPTLVVLGGDSPKLHPRFEETYQCLLAWMPRAEGVVVPAATHFLWIERPATSRLLAHTLHAFLARHSGVRTAPSS
jgi:pimeloyl-ACP methyl ester carboxylesterase